MKNIILAQSAASARALHAWLQIVFGEDLAGTSPGADDIIFDPSVLGHEGGVHAFSYLVQRIEQASDAEDKRGSYGSTTIFVDYVKPLRLNAADGAVTWNKLIAMLILTFPEVHWSFGILSGDRFCDDIHFPCEDLNLKSLFGPRRSPLFDSAGLRDWVRARTGEALARHSTPSQTRTATSYLPRRRRSAVALDDESAYSYLNAYTAYRFGFRATPISTGALADELLGGTSDNPNSDGHPQSSVQFPLPDVIFEDVYLNFPDGRPGLSKLYSDPHPDMGESRGRCDDWRLIESIRNRIFLTSGQRLHGDDDKHERNVAYIEGQRARGIHVKVLGKPSAGMFRLWRESGLLRRFHEGRADGFRWPPERLDFLEDRHGHSTPGALLVIAQTLLDRAESLLDAASSSVLEAVRGAVLATDALELLGGRTGTVAVRALRLKHQFELLAECQFAGIEHHLDVRSRIREIRREAVYISRWFGPRQRLRAALNSEMQVLLHLLRVLRDYGQFDEEQTVMDRIRRIHNTLWMRERPWRLSMWPVLRYIEFLLSSFPRFMLSLGAWVMVLAEL